jgi:cytochrome P450
MEIPVHVDSALVVDFDMYRPDGWEADLYKAWKRVQDSYPPIFWTPRNGGHWVVTRFDDIKRVAESFSDFSSTESFVPRGVAPPQLPLNLDPPEHAEVRRLLTPAVMPKQLKELRDSVHKSTIGIIETLSRAGECEFISAFASVIPVMAFLRLMGLPEEDQYFLNHDIGPDITRLNDPEAYRRARQRLTDYLQGWFDRFRCNPGPGLISAIIHAKPDQKQLSDTEIENLCNLLMAAGIDTVKSAMGFSAHFLSHHAAHRQRLIADPKLIPNAVEEFLRRFGQSNLARVTVRDLTYNNVHFKSRDMVMMPFPLAGLDEQVTDCPMEVDFGRKQFRHLNFGVGTHACIGAALARTEMAIFLQEWLARIPDFEERAGTKMRCSTGLVNVPLELHLTWEV